MTVDEVMQYRRAEPLRPFVLQLKDGREFVVREPEHIARDSRFAQLAVAAEDETGFALDIGAVQGVRLLDESDAHGKRKRRRP